jgi:acyl-CoA thioesterase
MKIDICSRPRQAGPYRRAVGRLGSRCLMTAAPTLARNSRGGVRSALWTPARTGRIKPVSPLTANTDCPTIESYWMREIEISDNLGGISVEAHALFKRDACALAFGISIVSAGSGEARVTMPVREDMINAHGICHGGITFALADTALAYAAASAGGTHVTTSATIYFTERAELGDVLTATCTRTSERDRSHIYDVVVRDGKAAVIAIFRGNCLQVRPSAGAGPLS